jgi:hypothetical protein
LEDWILDASEIYGGYPLELLKWVRSSVDQSRQKYQDEIGKAWAKYHEVNDRLKRWECKFRQEEQKREETRELLRANLDNEHFIAKWRKTHGK